MKKVLSMLLLLSIMVFALSACGMGKPKIEDYEWQMRTVMHTEDGQIIYDAVNEGNITYPEARIIEMILVANDGRITITDVTNGKTYEGTYAASGKNPGGTDYHITIEGKSGYATVAMTTYADETKEPTMPITLDGYSMYFYAR